MAFNKAKALQEAEKFVSQGKISQAIKQYMQVVEKEPSDLVILNTVGDLYVREKNIPEALKHFHKLAEAYSHEGFTVKAIAIYKKISKFDPNAVEVLVKTGDLYVLQGLAREARDQYAQAVEAYRKKNQTDNALEAFRKIVALDPENAGYRTKLADFCQQVGKKPEAAKAYAEAADLAFRHGDMAGSESALKKAASLDPQNSQVQLLRARVAIEKNDPAEAEKILSSAPDLKSSPAAQQILLQAYLAAHKIDQAEKLVVGVFRSNPMDFSPLASFAAQCIGKGALDTALKPLADVADSLIELKTTGPLMEVLRQIWQKSPHFLPALELIYKIADKTADEATIPEILVAMGETYTQQKNWEKAEWAFQKLVSREPENADYKALLRQVQQKQGKAGAATPADFAESEVALAPEAEAPAPEAPAAAAPSADEAAMVKEALENSDLFSQYGLAEKAVAELEKVLGPYPDQIDIHRRILEVCLKNLPERAAQAARELARIHASRGEMELAAKYEHTAATGAPPPVVEISAPPEPAPAPEAPPPAPPPPEPTQPAAVEEFDLSAGLPGAAPAEAPATAPTEIPLDLTPPSAEAEAAPPPAQEFDLSAGFESFAAPPEPAPAPAAEAAPGFNFEDSRVEIDFYLSQGFADEAQKAVEALEERFPGNPQVAELRRMVEQKAAEVPEPAPEPAPEPVPEPAPEMPQVAEEPELPPAFTQPPPIEPPPIEPPAAAGPVEEPTPPAPMPVEPTPAPEPAMEEPPPPAPPAPPAAAPADPLGSLVGDLAESLEGLEEQAPPAARQAPWTQKAPAGASAASPLSGLLEEFGEETGGAAAIDDPQTHYDLGVAFREMSLLDEAIGEFQKVVKGAQKGQYPPNFLQACTLLATCFMDKNLPAIAAKWYNRALETPNLDEEAILALEYDMGVAYEQAGDTKTALEKFSEVYSQNIDYRDVAEKIRQLQQKN
jgi:tetratricopeptide (TPR) repeat protein